MLANHIHLYLSWLGQTFLQSGLWTDISIKLVQEGEALQETALTPAVSSDV